MALYYPAIRGFVFNTGNCTVFVKHDVLYTACVGLLFIIKTSNNLCNSTEHVSGMWWATHRKQGNNSSYAFH